MRKDAEYILCRDKKCHADFILLRSPQWKLKMDFTTSQHVLEKMFLTHLYKTPNGWVGEKYFLVT